MLIGHLKRGSEKLEALERKLDGDHFQRGVSGLKVMAVANRAACELTRVIDTSKISHNLDDQIDDK